MKRIEHACKCHKGGCKSNTVLNQFWLEDAFIPTNPRLIANPQWMPSPATDGSTGYDVRYIAEKEGAPLIIYETETQPIDLGFKLELPSNLCVFLLPRSGTGINGHLILGNTVGVIDSDYPDNLKAALYRYDSNIENFDKTPIFTKEIVNESGDYRVLSGTRINDGDRIAQIVFMPSRYGICELFGYRTKPVTTKRTGGLGSTGVS